MHALAVARVVEDRRRRCGPAERGVVAHIGPQSADIGLALGQDRDGRIIAVQALGGKDMGLDALDQRRQDRGHPAHLVGECRQAQRHALAGIALGLAVKRLVLSELLEDDHGQQLGASPAARQDVEWRRGLGDGLTIPARDLLTDSLDHLPLARDDLQGLSDVLAELAQTRAAAAGAGLGRLDHHPLARQVFWEGLARGCLAGKRLHRGRGPGGGPLGGELVLRGRGFQLLQLQLQLIKQPAGPLRRRPEPLALELGDLQLQMGDQRLVVGALGLGRGGFSDSYGRIGARQITIGMRRIQLGLHAGQRRLQRFDILWNRGGKALHDPNGITDRSVCGASKCRVSKEK